MPSTDQELNKLYLYDVNSAVSDTKRLPTFWCVMNLGAWFLFGPVLALILGLLRFKHAYRVAGLELGADELPDHLAVVLEFAAISPDAGRRLLIEQRAGLELMRLGLREAGSPWASILDSVSATLPPLRGSEHEVVARLAASGPPEEEVGLEPFALPGGPR